MVSSTATSTTARVSDSFTALRTVIARELASLREIRHDLHRHPELSYQEARTSSVVARELTRLGIAHKTGMAKTGVIGYIPPTTGNAPTSVALRADMDALPIVEQTGRDYTSINPGVMHACGHDGHTTMLLGAARVLLQMPTRTRGVTLVFQPAEEGGAGGERLCAEGALKGDTGGGIGLPVGEIYGLHGWPTLDLGTVGTRPGPLLAAVDDFDVAVRGQGAHAAYPHQGRDPIVATCAIVSSLQTIASRNIAPLDSVVCTVGQINAGSANNIIPADCRFQGTVRTLRAETRTLAKDRFHAITRSIAEAHGCIADINWHESYPVTHNDAALVDKFLSTADAALGRERVLRIDQPTMGGEDFSYYGHHVPACFFFLGLKAAGATHVPTLHQPDFDFNDDAMPTGIEMLCRAALGA